MQGLLSPRDGRCGGLRAIPANRVGVGFRKGTVFSCSPTTTAGGSETLVRGRRETRTGDEDGMTKARAFSQE